MWSLLCTLASTTAVHHASDPVLQRATLRIAARMLVVVLDGVLDLLLGRLGVGAARAEAEQLGVEELLLGLGVGLEEDLEPRPDRGEPLVVVARPLLEHREHPPLLVVLVRDHVGDVHVCDLLVSGHVSRGSHSARRLARFGYHRWS